MELPYQGPLDWPFFLRYFQARSTPGVEFVRDGRYLRTIPGGMLEVAHSEGCLRVTGPPEVAPRVRRMFDLDADMDSVHAGLGRDPRLAGRVRDYPGLRVPGAWSGFEVLARAIVGQQVSVKAASTLMGRLASRCGEPVAEGYLFPSGPAVAAADLSGLGMPGRRVAALQNAAALPEPWDRATLLAQPGIGPWTAEYFALRWLRDPDAWPGTDLVLKRAGSFEGVRPYRAYAAVHLWCAGG